MKKQVSGVGGLASLAKKDWMNTRLRLTLACHVDHWSTWKMGNIVPSPVSHKCNDFGYLQPLLTYLLNIMYIPGTLNKYFLVKKMISMILWGHIEMGETNRLCKLKSVFSWKRCPKAVWHPGESWNKVSKLKF